MIAILTKVLPATNTKPMRVKASTGGQSCIVSWSECDQDDRDAGRAHLYAAQQLCKKMNWPGQLLGGGTPTGYAFVFADTSIK